MMPGGDSSASKRAKPAAVPVLGYWKIRGLAAPIVYLFEYLGAHYELAHYEQGDDMSREEWLKVKPALGLAFPNLPYLIHGEDVKLTESLAILRYVCNTYDPALLGKTPRDAAVADMVFGTVNDVRAAIANICYSSGDRVAATKKAMNGMENVNRFMEGRNFVVGDYVTFVDFFLFEQEMVMEWITEGSLLKTYPALKAHHDRMRALPRLGEFLDSKRFMSRPFNNKCALLNN